MSHDVDGELARLRAELDELRRTVAELVDTQRGGRFEELEVERVNVVEPDGRLVIVISGEARAPDPIVDGKPLSRPGRKRRGIFFYNDEGDECGGLTFSGCRDGDHYVAGAGLMFDQFKQDQVVAMMHGDADRQRWAAFRVWDRPDLRLPELIERWEAIGKLGEESERAAAMRNLQAEGHEPAERVFVGKTTERAAVVRLCDPEGRVRLLLSVDAFGRPTVEFLDERGSVECRLPEAVHGDHAAPPGSGDEPLASG